MVGLKIKCTAPTDSIMAGCYSHGLVIIAIVVISCCYYLIVISSDCAHQDSAWVRADIALFQAQHRQGGINAWCRRCSQPLKARGKTSGGQRGITQAKW